jgi:RNA polymerase sigma-70 factor (ECF subfamily)
MPYQSDVDLRDRIIGGDRAAAEALFQRFLEALYEFVYYRVGGDRELCESIVEDTLLTAFENLRGFEGRSSMHTWMCGIAKNKIRSQRRVRRPKPIADVLADADDEIDAILLGIEAEPLPEEVLERRETRELVGATLSSLPPEYRAVLIDKYVAELTVSEIASKTRRGGKATESLLHRARAAFVRVFELLARRRGGGA